MISRILKLKCGNLSFRFSFGELVECSSLERKLFWNINQSTLFHLCNFKFTKISTLHLQIHVA